VAYEFVVCFHTSKDETVAFRCPELRPLPFVLGVDVDGEVLGPVYTAGFGVADVCYVVDVTLRGVLDGVCELWVAMVVYPVEDVRPHLLRCISNALRNVGRFSFIS